LFSDGSLQERAAWAGGAETASQCQFQLLVNRTFTLQTQIMHDMRDQYSRVPYPCLFSGVHFYVVKSEYKQCTVKRQVQQTPCEKGQVYLLYIYNTPHTSNQAD
jgi:hypothetical protein